VGKKDTKVGAVSVKSESRNTGGEKRSGE